MTKDTEKKKPLSLGGKLELKLPAGASQPTAAGGAAKVRQSLAQGRSRSVQVEVKRRRPAGPEPSAPAKAASPAPEAGSDALPTLTAEEKARRAQAVLGAVKGSESQASIRKQLDDEFARKKAEAEAVRLASEAESKKRREGEETRKKSEEQAKTRAEEQAKRLLKAPSTATEDSEEEGRKGGPAKRRAGGTPWKGAEGIRAGKLSLTRVLSTEDGEIERTRSLASMRRARQKEKLKAQGPEEDKKIIRDVIIPETITVGELANRMAVRGADVIKSLMKMGMMVTISQPIDADTAELIVQEFGHKVKRVTEADIEIGLSGQEDKPEDMTPRPPVVTIMGHVDHGKTSL
ncbi:MAG: translation initiation factor IF-2 N-terminal domain-containing protein, partial [Dongiaceae bacterium]